MYEVGELWKSDKEHGVSQLIADDRPYGYG